MSITNAQKARKRGLKKVFNSLTLQTYQTYIQEAFKVFEWLSMTFLASFLKTETLVMENYCPGVTSVKFSISIITHQGHISQVSANADSVTQ